MRRNSLKLAVGALVVAAAGGVVVARSADSTTQPPAPVFTEDGRLDYEATPDLIRFTNPGMEDVFIRKADAFPVEAHASEGAAGPMEMGDVTAPIGVYDEDGKRVGTWYRDAEHRERADGGVVPLGVELPHEPQVHIGPDGKPAKVMLAPE